MNFTQDTIAQLFSIADPVWTETIVQADLGAPGTAGDLLVLRLSGTLDNYRADAAMLANGTIAAVHGQAVSVSIGAKFPPNNRDAAKRRCLRALALDALVYAAAMTVIKTLDQDLRPVAADSTIEACKPVGPTPVDNG